MGLRDYLMNLKSIEESTGGFASSAEAIRKQGLQDKFKQNLPSLLQSGDVGALAQGAYEAGDNTILEQLSKNIIDKNKPSDKPKLTRDQIATLPITDEGKRAMEAAESLDQQKFLGSQYATGASLDEKKLEFKESEGRRAYEKVTSAYDKRFSKLENELFDTRVDLDTMKEALNSDTVPGQFVVTSLGSRKIAGQTGVLTDADISRLDVPAIGKTLASFQNWITNNAKGTWPPEVKKAMSKLIDVAESRYKDVIKTELVGRMNIAKGNKFLFDQKTETASDLMNELGEQYGIKYNKEKKKFELPEDVKKELSLKEAKIQEMDTKVKSSYENALANLKKTGKVTNKKTGKTYTGQEAVDFIDEYFGVTKVK